jgi:hypothetical protein
MKKLFIVFAILCLATPVMAAAQWEFYGSARMTTFRVDVDPDVPGVGSTTNTQWTQQGNSRIGANVKFNDEIGGRFEMSDSFGKRMLYVPTNSVAANCCWARPTPPSAPSSCQTAFSPMTATCWALASSTSAAFP